MGEKLRENITGWLFIAPAVIIISLFGLFPIVYAAYMSLFEWVIRPRFTYCLPHLETLFRELPRNRRDEMVQLWQLDFTAEIIPRFDAAACLTNYSRIVGDWGGVALFVGGFAVLIAAWLLWQRAFAGDTYQPQRPAAREISPFIKLGVAAAVLALALGLITIGWERMFAAGNQKFLNGLIYTLYYALASVPVQLALGLLLAYVLFQNIRGKTFFRIVYFLPYITPAVAAATVFGIIFSPRPSSLINQAIGLVGLEPQKWIAEARPFVNALFGFNLSGFFAGPSMALISIVLLGLWTYVGYNTVIYLAGLGQIPGDLYEAARVDGANDWHLFRYITLPLLSPVTFYLSILGFIGTFQAFSQIYVMRSPQAQGTTDTVSIVVFDTFRGFQQYGQATAQAIVLMLIILAITQFQRSVLEKQVFYG
jgi:multiple sugar transport system permease protein